MEEVNSDPFASIANICQISYSQEQFLNHCSSGLQPPQPRRRASLSDHEEFPVASTAITMVSPPPTPEDKQKDEKDDSTLPYDDVFQTPPDKPAFLSALSQNHSQVDQQQVIVDCGIEALANERAGNHDEFVTVDSAAGGNRADDEGDKDLGFTVEAELTERIEIESESNSGGAQNSSQDKEVIHCEYMEGKVPKRRLGALNSDLGEPSIKRSKLHDSNKNENMGLVTPQSNLTREVGKSFERLLKSAERFKLGAPGASLGSQAVKCLESLVKSVDVLLAASKRAKTLDGNLASEIESRNQNLGKSGVELGYEGAGCSNHGLRLPQTDQIKETEIEMDGDDVEYSRERMVKRKLAFSTEMIESVLEANNAASGFAGDGVQGISSEKEGSEADRLATARLGHCRTKSRDDFDKFRYFHPSGVANACGSEKIVREKRVLPTSICGTKENDGAREAEPDDVSKQRNSAGIGLLDVLNMLVEDFPQDPSLEKLSILEVAKRRGMTFP